MWAHAGSCSACCQYLQVLFFLATVQLFCDQPIVLCGVVMAKVWDPVPDLFKPHILPLLFKKKLNVDVVLLLDSSVSYILS